MIKKEIRQNAIKRLVNENRIKTQDELIQLLEEKGFKVGQSTVSRDIKELDLIKLSLPDIDSFYILKEKEAEWISQYQNGTTQSTNTDFSNETYESRIRNVFHDSVISVDSAYFLIIIHTLPGMAQAAAHVIDLLNLTEVAGTIAGDDTIFVAVKSEKDISKLKRTFENLL